MKQKTRWEKCRVKCPEDKIDTEIMLEWHEESGKKVLTGIGCKNPKLMDLSPQDCQWSCWEEIEKGKGASR